MEYSKFNKTFFFLLLLVLLIIAAFNYLVDPFDIYKIRLIRGFNENKPALRRQERLTKNFEFKLDKNRYDAIFLGSSKVDFALNPEYYEKITGKKAKNLAIVGASPEEITDIAQMALAVHPEIKKIYIGLDFFSFEKYYSTRYKMNLQHRVTPTEYFVTLFSFDACSASWATIKANRQIAGSTNIKNVNNSPDTYEKFEEIITTFSKNHYIGYQLSAQKLTNFAKFADFCEENKVELILFISPTHVSLLQAIDEAGILSVYEDWKSSLTKISPIIDFSFLNEINCEKISNNMVYYSDAAHVTDLAGEMVLDKLVLNKGKYGNLITDKNIDKCNIETRKKLKKWAKNNKDWVEKIRELQK